MKKEYDFSKGKRGQFYRPNTELNIPVYLEPDVAKAARRRAHQKDVTVSKIVHEWLRRQIQSQTKKVS